MSFIADYARGRDNNFNLLRMFAASTVIYSHAFPIVHGLTAAGQPNWSGDWLFDWSGVASGGAAVQVFFAMSGFLVAQSLSRHPSVKIFLGARALRLLPALFVSVLVTVFALGLVFTSLSAAEYLRRGEVWSYLSHNLTLRCIPTAALPGLFEFNPYPKVANGSLWTLTWEVFMYLSLAAAFALGLLRRTAWLTLAVGVVYVAAFASHEGKLRLPGLLWFPGYFFGYFYCGVLLWVHRRRIPGSRALLLLAVAVLALVLDRYQTSALARLLYPAVLAYAVISLALIPDGLMRRYNSVGDYSYGVYIYAFPVEQLMIQSIPRLNPWELSGLTLLATLLLAVPSWHLLEEPMLALKQHLLPKPLPGAAARA